MAICNYTDTFPSKARSHFIVLKCGTVFPERIGTLKEMQNWQKHYTAIGRQSCIFKNVQANAQKALDWMQGRQDD